MSEALHIPGTNIVALEALADGAGVDISTFIGQSIGLGLNLADIAIDAGCQGAVLFQQPAGDYTKHDIDFSPSIKPQLLDEMVSFECALDYQPPYQLILPSLILEAVEEVSDILATTRAGFIESAIFFRHHWALTRQHRGEILVDDRVDGGSDFLVVEDDSAMFRYDIDN